MTDRTTLRAIMDAMKPGPTQDAAYWQEEARQLSNALSYLNSFATEMRDDAVRALTNLKPSNTKAQLLEGIEEARAILNGDAK